VAGVKVQKLPKVAKHARRVLQQHSTAQHTALDYKLHTIHAWVAEATKHNRTQLPNMRMAFCSSTGSTAQHVGSAAVDLAWFGLVAHSPTAGSSHIGYMQADATVRVHALDFCSSTIATCESRAQRVHTARELSRAQRCLHGPHGYAGTHCHTTQCRGYKHTFSVVAPNVGPDPKQVPCGHATTELATFSHTHHDSIWVEACCLFPGC
jgi:hypothetical protein